MIVTLVGTPTGTSWVDLTYSSVGFSVRHLMGKGRGRSGEVDGQIVTGPSLGDRGALDICTLPERG
ncbi:hypothetical protein BA895_22730 [Humibacillus sp. DSM 29435]|uniref:hypothetical protein n=1 Tax=Humibacillus sp. DSM 29435 TaxID=1869167 RepID=UPI0008723061|nr:hypothetical protein [Humibacillus sp. DSM 29435]OFE15198.1 hypothetical protein BA895_22730 [Humibacillus sp. DSM 29435]